MIPRPAEASHRTRGPCGAVAAWPDAPRPAPDDEAVRRTEPGRDVGPSPNRHGRRLAVATASLTGIAMAAQLGHDGSPGWRLARVTGVAVVTILVIGVATRAPLRASGRVIAPLGIVVAGFAVGFVPFVLADPWSVRSVAGATALLGGIVLASLGVVLATRRRRARRRVASAVVMLLAAVCFGFVVGPAVAATNVPRPTLGATPADRALAFETVEVTTTDDVRLAGWYLTSMNEAAVVLLHGAGSTRSDVLEQAIVLHRRGFGVLMIDVAGTARAAVARWTSAGKAMPTWPPRPPSCRLVLMSIRGASGWWGCRWGPRRRSARADPTT